MNIFFNSTETTQGAFVRNLSRVGSETLGSRESHPFLIEVKSAEMEVEEAAEIEEATMENVQTLESFMEFPLL